MKSYSFSVDDSGWCAVVDDDVFPGSHATVWLQKEDGAAYTIQLWADDFDGGKELMVNRSLGEALWQAIDEIVVKGENVSLAQALRNVTVGEPVQELEATLVAALDYLRARK